MRGGCACAGRRGAGLASPAGGAPGSGVMMLTAGIEADDGKSILGRPGAVFGAAPGVITPELSVGSLSGDVTGAAPIVAGPKPATAGVWETGGFGCGATEGCVPANTGDPEDDALTATPPGFQASEWRLTWPSKVRNRMFDMMRAFSRTNLRSGHSVSAQPRVIST